MHTVTVCPRCKIDFMYHSSETFLEREITIIDEVGNNEVLLTFICQDCHNVENNIDGISIRYNLTTYEDYKEDVRYFWENGDINELEADGIITVDGERYREDRSLSYRLLTESEFNGRFKIYPETDYPYQDTIWPSRRWNKNYNDYIDLGGGEEVIEDRGSEDLPF